jgi:hypothetical protein
MRDLPGINVTDAACLSCAAEIRTALTWHPFGEVLRALLIAAEIPFAAEDHSHTCIKIMGNTIDVSCFKRYRCFLSAAARAVASSTMSGRNGMHY